MLTILSNEISHHIYRVVKVAVVQLDHMDMKDRRYVSCAYFILNFAIYDLVCFGRVHMVRLDLTALKGHVVIRYVHFNRTACC